MPTKEKEMVEFQRAFSEFISKYTAEEGPIGEFVLFYLSDGGAGVIQSFESVNMGLAYALHVSSTVLRRDTGKDFKSTAYVVSGGQVHGSFDLGENDEEKPN